MKRILVATDGSEHSNKAVELAIWIAKRWNSRVYLMHVVSSPVSRARFEKLCVEILDPAEIRLKKAGVKIVESVCIGGNPADEILKAAERYKVDAIVMGNRGKGGLSKAIMGSVSTKVCKLAKCTCITVK